MKAKEEYTAKVEKMKKSSDILRYQDIPWPCEGTVQDMVDVMLADAKEGFQTYFNCTPKGLIVHHPFCTDQLSV